MRNLHQDEGGQQENPIIINKQKLIYERKYK